MESFKLVKLFSVILSFIPSIFAISFLNLFNFQHQRALSASSLRHINDFSGRTPENEPMDSMVYTSALSIPRKPLALNQLPHSMGALKMIKPRPATSLYMRQTLKRPLRTKSGSTLIRPVPIEASFRQLPTAPVTSIYQALNTRQIPAVQYPLIFGTRLELQEPQELPMRNYYKEGTRYAPKKQYVNLIHMRPMYPNNQSTSSDDVNSSRKVKFATNTIDDESTESYVSSPTNISYDTSAQPSDDIKPVHEIFDEDDAGFQIHVNGVVQHHKIDSRK